MKPKIINFYGGPGCHIKNTPILMYDGNIKMVQDIEVGDLLMGDDSTPRQVIKLCSGIDDMYEIIPNKGDSYVVNSKHILCLKRHTTTSKLHKKITIIKEISVKDWLKKSKKFKIKYKGYKSDVEFQQKNVTIDPYFLGVWLGDGDSRWTRITNIDKEIIEFINLYANNLGLNFKENLDSKTQSISSFNKNKKRLNPLLIELQKLNLINNKHIPFNYKINSKEIRLQLLAGLLDTDGSYQKNGFEFINKNKSISEDVAWIAKSLGFRSKVSECKKRCVNNGVWGIYWRVGIYGDLNIIPTRIKRKQALKRQNIRNDGLRKFDPLVTGIKIKYHSRDRYYGFEIDGNHRYLLGDFTVTHNTGKSTMAAAVFAELKSEGVEVELVTEYAKKKVWEEAYKVFECQLYVCAKQAYDIFNVAKHVDLIVTDSPIIMSLAYTNGDRLLDELMVREHKKYDGIDIFLTRTKKYNPKGRYQTEEEAKEKDTLIKKILKDAELPFVEFEGHKKSLPEIIKYIHSKR